MKVIHHVLDVGAPAPIDPFNWDSCLESLRLFCTTGVGKPFRPSS